ncbi:NADPH-dependent FMN reductase [Sphingobacterium wenxiniae]|uniref:NAD(P)H-dependent FMN reductase n=1 Tax=Sphingobacterium wenxiniae TaxID=683125 RepID=A0A1I6Q6I7_9SPHI|nr:NADPH-dependent FMN reductase [Sphingobacterium wenxiniae]SFS48083.1 NAD(P)H-dependent FMN reductase [Sphingobacterium wenxiniae]
MSNKKIGIIVGSLRKESFNKKIANYLMQHAPEGYQLECIEIGQLPLYNQDYDEGNTPQSYSPFRTKVKNMDAIIFVTPEYNRSVPGVLKNAIDVGSRPYGQSAWDGKPAWVVSSSIGNLSAFGANHHLRQSLVFLNMPTLQQPEVYIANVQKLFDEQGNLTDEKTGKFLRDTLSSFIAFAKRFDKL